jgi:hypothetical protein
MHPQQITARHLQRLAYLYVRQRTLQQVLEHTESTERQYALRDRALALVPVANPGGMKGAFSGQCSIIGLPVHPAFGGVPGAPVRRWEATDL